MTVNQTNTKEEKKPYSKPTIESEEMFESEALPEPEYTSEGQWKPYPQFNCGSLPQRN